MRGWRGPLLTLAALVMLLSSLSEFGPLNVVYHEGRKHRVTSCILPVGGVEERLTQAKICHACGAIYPGEVAQIHSFDQPFDVTIAACNDVFGG